MQRFAAIVLILAASTAHADELKWKWRDVFSKHFSELSDMTRYTGNKGPSATACHDDIKRATEDGLPANTQFAKDGEIVRFSEMGKVCDDYTRAYQAAELHPAMRDAEEALETMKIIMDAHNGNPKDQASFVQKGKDCFAAADRADQLGIGDVNYNDKVLIKDVRAKICEPEAKAAASWASDVEKAGEADRAELEAPFKAVGIKGDKLFTCTQHHVIRGIGGGELEPAQIKKASVLFALEGGEGSYTLYRYVFKGDKFVRRTSHDYYLRPGPKAYR